MILLFIFFFTEPEDCDLSHEPVEVLASCVKKFLRELPDPLIPSKWYDCFIEASSKSFIFDFKIHKAIL